MAKKSRSQKQFIRARRAPGGRIQPREIRHELCPKGFCHAGEILPDYRTDLPAKRLKILLDEDASNLKAHLESLGSYKISTVASIGITGAADEKVAKNAKSHKSILITFNHKDFFSEDRGIIIGQCPGIIAIRTANNHFSNAMDTMWVVEALLNQIGKNVLTNWWLGKKISVTSKGFVLKYRSSQGIEEIEGCLDTAGIICLKRTK